MMLSVQMSVLSGESLGITQAADIETDAYGNTGDAQGTETDSFIAEPVNDDQQEIDSHNTEEEIQQNHQVHVEKEIGEILSTERFTVRTESVEDTAVDNVQE